MRRRGEKLFIWREEMLRSTQQKTEEEEEEIAIPHNHLQKEIENVQVKTGSTHDNNTAECIPLSY